MSKKRPSGEDITKYKGADNWSYRRWAWEFLIRNKEFIQECDRVNDLSDDEKEEVAQKFALKEFKRYDSPYNRKSGLPIFLSGKISSYTHDFSTNEEILKSIRSYPGHVLINFDLNWMVKEERSLNKQISLARKRLKRKRDAYAGDMKINTHKSKRVFFGVYLRVLDLSITYNNDKLKIAEIVASDRGIKKLSDFKDELLKHFERAELLANEEYVYLATVAAEFNAKNKKKDGKPIVRSKGDPIRWTLNKVDKADEVDK